MRYRISRFSDSVITIIFFILGIISWLLASCMYFVARNSAFFSIFWMLFGLGLMIISSQMLYIIRVFRNLRRKARVRKGKRKKTM